MNHFFFLAQTTTTESEGGSTLGIIIALVVAVIEIASFWVLYSKADQPGWAAIIPIYNIWVWLKVIDRPWWWLILLFIPFVNIIVIIAMYLDLAKSFGKGMGFGCGLIILPIIFLPLLAFGGAQYTGRS